MLKPKHAALLFSISSISTSLVQAHNDAMSLNGFTGLFNVPSAHVTEYGTGAASYSDMMFYRGEYRHNNNVVGSFGIFPHVEVSGRIAWFNSHTNLFIEDEPEARDLSANIKINIPFIPDNWFELAIGEQDIGGEANFFDAKYIVASRSFGPLRIDIGKGQNDLNGRLDGVFGGIELAPYDWISLIAEHDAQDTNIGFRLSTPESWMPEDFRIDLTVLADTDSETGSGKSFYGINLKFPLGGGFSGKRTKPLPTTTVANAKSKQIQKQHLARSKFKPARVKPAKKTMADFKRINNEPAGNSKLENSAIHQIAVKLKEEGFDRVDVGSRQGNLIVAFENNIYNRSELDALGIVLANVARLAKGSFNKTTIVLKNQGIPVIAIDTNPKGYADFLEHNAAAPLYAYYPAVHDYSNVQWKYYSANELNLKPRITISPILNSGIATEYGVWDYSFGAAINGAVHLWPGAIASITYTQELDHSDDFDENGPFRNAKIENDVKEITIQQAIKFTNLLYNNLHIGTFRYNYKGFQNETLLNSHSGEHQLSFRFGDFEDSKSNQNKDFRLLKYRYYWPRYDVAISATHGKFWDGDKGYRVNSLFRFGDQTVELFYKDVKAPKTDEQVEFIGIAWTLPLTPRKDWDSAYLQVKGHEAWRWGFQTRINNETNNVAFGVADIAPPEWDINRTYLNNDKLSPEYIYQNLARLKRH